MTTDTTGGAPSRVHSSTIYAGAALLLLVVAGTIVLSVMGWDSQRIAGVWATAGGGAAVLLPILNKVTSLFQASEQQKQATEQQNQVLATIAHNTNGVLRDKIRDEIRAAIPDITQAIRDAWNEPVPYTVTDPDPAPPPAGATWTRDDQGRRWATYEPGRHRDDPLDEVA